MTLQQMCAIECQLRAASFRSHQRPSASVAFGARSWLVVGMGLLLWVVCGPSLWALRKDIRSKARNFPNAQVIVKQSTVKLEEVFSTPTQMVLPGSSGLKATPSHIQYANRAGQLPSTFILRGEVICQNKSRQVVEAVGLTVALLDAFHQPVQVGGQNAPLLYKLQAHITPSMETELTWEKQMDTLDVFEVAVVVTRVRFADGSVWMAPQDEMVDVS